MYLLTYNCYKLAKTRFIHFSKYGDCHVLSDIFNKDRCKGASSEVYKFEKVEGNMDSSINKIKKKYRNQLIKTFRKAYPYGLKNHVSDDNRKEKTGLVGVTFPSLSSTHSKTRGIKYNYAKKKKTSSEEFLNSFPNTIKVLNIKVASLNKRSFKDLANIFIDEITRFTISLNICIDTIKSNFYSHNLAKKFKKTCKKY